MTQPSIIKTKAHELADILGLEIRHNEEMIIEVFFKQIFAQGLKTGSIHKFRDMGCNMNISTI
jgi:hypothetical protein